jgi:hypothetical protein
MNRQCGDCQLCCKLLPMKNGTTFDHPESRALFGHPETIPEFFKPAGERCPHQRHHKGCNVYAKRPLGCRIWNCRWLVNDDTAAMRRPDRSHYVIDLIPDFVRIDQQDGSEPVPVQVVQVWIDPDYPDAHRDPALRAYLARLGERDGIIALIRVNATEAFTLWPPAMCPDGQFNELHSHGAVAKQWSTWPGAKLVPLDSDPPP